LPGTEDPGAAVAFALGWQVAELYRNPHRMRPDTRPPPEDLPGVGGLTNAQRTDLGLRQIEAGIHRLLPRIALAGLAPPEIAPVRLAFADEGDTSEPPDLRALIVPMHTATLETLTAADFRLGKAYGLGRAMADTAEVDDDASLARQFDRWRIRQLDTWLADLDSAFPAHASSAVRMSLARWTQWALQPSLGGRPLVWDRDIVAVRQTLYRQAQRWRALLSGEKAGLDMLKAKDYLAATKDMLSRAGQLFWGVVRHLWFVFLFVAALIALAVLLLINSDSTSSNVAAIGAMAAAIGVTWQGVGTAVWRAAQRLEQPLWGAALNVAISEAITQLPGQSAGSLLSQQDPRLTEPHGDGPTQPLDRGGDEEEGT
jgi:hypothetical protein